MKPIYYGWWIVLASFAVAFYVAGTIFYGFTAFIEPLASEFGWSYTQISLAASLRGLEMGLLAPFVGILVDRYSAPRVLHKYMYHRGFFFERKTLEKAWTVAPLEMTRTGDNTRNRVYASLSEGGDVLPVLLAMFIGLVDGTQELVEYPATWFSNYQATFGNDAAHRYELCLERVQLASISPQYQSCMCNGVDNGYLIGINCLWW